MKCGFVGTNDNVLAFIGSNCSIQGLDAEGDEKYWNMSSDNVLAICFCDIDEDQEYELILGCEDSTINIFKGEEMLYEIDESAPVSILASFGLNHYGFGLTTGSYGVYQGRNLLWKERYKEGIVGMTCIFSNQANGLVIGFRNGRVEVREQMSGEEMYTLNMDRQLSCLLRSNFVDLNVEDQVLAVLRNGEVFGYDINWDYTPGDEIGTAVGGVELTVEKKMMNLTEKKNILTSQLTQLKGTRGGKKKLSSVDRRVAGPAGGENRSGRVGAGGMRTLIPLDTRITCGFRFNFNKKCPEIVFKTGSSAVIRGAIVYGEKILEKDCFS